MPRAWPPWDAPPAPPDEPPPPPPDPRTDSPPWPPADEVDCANRPRKGDKKADIQAWLLANGVDIDPPAVAELTKREMLQLVARLCDEDSPAEDV